MPNSPPRDAGLRYDVFISYSHAADGETAAQLQRALQRIAKPWYRLRGMRVFRDETDLSVAPEGWSVSLAADGVYKIWDIARQELLAPYSKPL